MIDFGKINSGNAVNTILPPREIFNALPKKMQLNFNILEMFNLKFGQNGLNSEIKKVL
jgi:hypothetical protein